MTMTKSLCVWIAAGLLGFGTGCGDNSEQGDDSPASGGGNGEAGATGTGGQAGGANPDANGGEAGGANPDANGGEAGGANPDGTAGGAGAAGNGDNPAADEFGFVRRVPEQERTVTCSESPAGLPEEPGVFPDADVLCTFDDGTTTGHVYVQATPVDCTVLMGAVAIYELEGGWISVDGTVTPLEGGQYDFGGNHANDSLEFDYAGRHYRYFHSSLGFGGRACQPMDCLQIYESDATTLVEDGCTMERTLPVVCVPINPDATAPELEDTFTPCPGDPNYE
jgi:hypothetical protein